MEVDDVTMFLARLGTVGELTPLVAYLTKLVGLSTIAVAVAVAVPLPQSRMGEEEESPSSSFSNLNTTNRIFDKPISGIHLQVGQEPIVRFYSTREEPEYEIKIKKEDCTVDITLQGIQELCHGLEFYNGTVLEEFSFFLQLF
jgi:hypothetical protein